MKKMVLFLSVAGLLVSCGTSSCDCDLIHDNYTNTALTGWSLESSMTVVEDTCLDAGIIDTTYNGGNAYMQVSRVHCP